MLFSLLLTALGLGLAYAAAPGAVNTEAIRRGALHGGRSALLVETGSLIGDSVWALLALTGVMLLAHFLPAQIILGITGGFFLLRMAWVALRSALAKRSDAETVPASTRGDFATGAVFGLANPVGLAFWSGLGSSVVASGATGLNFVLFFAGFFIGAVLWCLLISAALHWGRRWLRPFMFRWINVLCALALGFFGLRILWTTLQELLEGWLLPAMKPEH